MNSSLLVFRTAGPAPGPVDNGPSPENPPDPDSDTEPQQSGDFTDEATVGQECTYLDQLGEPPSCSIEDYLLLRLENRELEQENDELDLEVQSLKEQLFESRSQGRRPQACHGLSGQQRRPRGRRPGD